MRRDSAAAARHAVVVEAQLARLRAGLEDLAAARRGQRGAGGPVSPVELGPFVRAALEPWRATLRRCSFDWRAGAATALADRGRLAQAIGNVLANSAEHGTGELEVRARRVPGGIRLEFRNGNRQLGQAAERGAGQPGAEEPGAEEPGAGEPRSAERCAREPGAVGAGRADRGKGVAIASQAARDLGGRLLVDVQPARTLAVLELPEEPASNPSPGRAGPDLAA
jgi:signal transduction histidine kinase